MPVNMKRWIACLAPWMVVSAVWAQSFEPVSVQLAANAPSKVEAYRLGDHCYITPKLAKSWGWNVTVKGEEVEIATEGKLFRVPTHKRQNELLLSLTDSARYLGAHHEWEGDFYRVLSRIRNVELTMQALQVDSTMRITPKITRVANPDRLVIDFPGAKMDVDTEESKLPAWWRLGQYNSSTARIVLEHPAAVAIAVPKIEGSRQFSLVLPEIAKIPPSEVKGPVKAVSNPATTPKVPAIKLDNPKVESNDGNGTLLTINASTKLTVPPAVQYISPTQLEISFTNSEFKEAVTGALTGSTWVNEITQIADGSNAVLIVNTKRPMAFSASTSGSLIRIRLFNPAAGGSLAGKIFVIDPGHGGKDSGTTFGKLTEKNIVLPISQKLKELLTKAGASVIMTRDSDVYPSLGDRAQLANKSQATMFISIHVNSIKLNNGKSGGMTFYHQQDPIDRLLAECIQSEIAKVSKIPDLGAWSDRKIYQSGFKVLRDSMVPSVLIEIGFINHDYDRAQMTKTDFGDRIAAAIMKGVQIFLGENY